MGQAVILTFLERYKRSKGFRQKSWLSAKDIFCRLRKTKNAVGLTSVTQSLKKLRNMGMIYWSPRILSILFAIFISLFALDVFGAGYSFWETVLALVMHLIPTYLIIIATLIAWKWEIVGGSIFIALGIFYIFMTRGRMHFSAYLFIAGPLLLIGGMFILHRIVSRKS